MLKLISYLGCQYFQLFSVVVYDFIKSACFLLLVRHQDSLIYM